MAKQLNAFKQRLLRSMPLHRQRRSSLLVCLIALAIIYNLVARSCISSREIPPFRTASGTSQAPLLESNPTLSSGRQSDDCSVGDDRIFEQVVQRVMKILPDEAAIQELLKPLVGSGKERLHDLAIRTRAYKQLFEAWEELHLVPAGSVCYVRGNIIQLLRCRFSTPDRSALSLAEIIRQYEAYNSLIHELGALLFQSTSPYFADHMTLHSQFYRGGRGIVLSAGNDQALYLVTSIMHIRSLGCQLPIEVMYLGDDDLDEENQRKLEQLPGVITRDIRRMVDDKEWELKGWAGKPWAILLSSFREVLFIDADSLFFQDPEGLFQDPGYVKTGALFFHDRLMMKESKRDWLKETLPKPISAQARQSRFWKGQSAHMQESGVVLVDKWKHFIPLLLVSRMNGPDRDGDKDKGITGVYDMLFGDKETFWIGWELAGDLDYAFHSGLAGVMGTVTLEPGKVEETAEKRIATTGLEPHVHTHDSKVTMCAPQLLHMAYDGSPLWFNGWIIENKFKKDDIKLQKFERYMREPAQITDPEAWDLGEDNMCCLSGLETFEFTTNETNVLNTAVRFALEVGAVSLAS